MAADQDAVNGSVVSKRWPILTSDRLIEDKAGEA